MAVLKSYLLLGVALGLTACERAPTPFEMTREHVAVHAVLLAGSDRAPLKIARFRPLTQRTAPLTGLGVALIQGSDTLRLEQAQPGMEGCAGVVLEVAEPGCYTGRLSAPIRSGEHYELDIELPGGERAWGTALVPNPPQVLTPEIAQRIPLRCPSPDECRTVAGSKVLEPLAIIPTSWRAKPDAARIELDLHLMTVYRDGQAVDDAQCRFFPPNPQAFEGAAETHTEFRIYEVSCGTNVSSEVHWDSIAARVVVTAFDTAYARYANTVFGRESLLDSYASAGIRGALGVFGGAASSEREVILVRQNH